MTEETVSALPEPSLLAFPDWLEQNQATIKEPLQKYRGYSDYVKQETLAQGRYSDTLVAKLDTKLAGLAVESGDYALPEGATEYNPADVLARPRNEEIPAKSILNFAYSTDVADDDPLRPTAAKYEAVRRLADEGRATPEELAAAEADLRQIATPEIMSRATRKDVTEGRSLAAIVPPEDPNGAPTVEINDALLDFVNEDGTVDEPALGKALKMHGTDASLIPAIRAKLSRPPGYAKTAAEIEKHGEAMSTLDTLARTASDDRFAVFEELGRIANSRERGNSYAQEYGVFNLRRAMGEQAKGKSDAELLTLADDFNNMNAMPELDEADPAKALRTLSTGQVVAPLNLMLNDTAFEKAVNDPSVPLAQRDHIRLQRDYAVEASASDIIRTIADNPQGGDEFVAYMDAQRAEKKTDAEIVKGWIGMGKFSTTKSTLAGLRSSLGEAVMPYVALATGADPDGFAIRAMQGMKIEDANRRAYADLFGKPHGMAYDLGQIVAPVAVDLGAAFLTRGVATGAVAVGKATAGTAVRNVMKTALTAPTRTFVQSWVKAGAASTAKGMGVKLTGRETADEVVSMAGRDIVSKIATGTAYATSMATGFNRSALSTYASLSTALSNQTNPDGTPKYTQEEVREIAMTHGLAAGTITAGVMAGFFGLGAPGMEMVLRKGLTNGQYARIAGRLKKDVAGFGAADANTMISQFVKQGVTPLFKSPALLGVAQEGAEEGLDTFMQYFNEARAMGDRISIADAAKQALYGASLGGVMGGTIAGVGTMIKDNTTPSPRVEADIRRERLLEMAAKLESTAPQTAQVFRNYAFQQRALIPQRQQLEGDLKAAKTPEAKAEIKAKIDTLNEQSTKSRTEELDIATQENLPEADAAEGTVEAPSDAGMAPEGETVAEGTPEAGRRGMPRGFTGTPVAQRMRATRESVETEFAELVEETPPEKYSIDAMMERLRSPSPTDPLPEGQVASASSPGATPPLSKKQITEQRIARLESARQNLKDIVDDKELKGKMRVDRIANHKRLIDFLSAAAYSGRPLKTIYSNGDLAAFDDGDAPDGFQSIIMLEGANAGASRVVSDDYAKSYTTATDESLPKGTVADAGATPPQTLTTPSEDALRMARNLIVGSFKPGMQGVKAEFREEQQRIIDTFNAEATESEKELVGMPQQNNWEIIGEVLDRVSARNASTQGLSSLPGEAARGVRGAVSEENQGGTVGGQETPNTLRGETRKVWRGDAVSPKPKDYTRRKGVYSGEAHGVGAYYGLEPATAERFSKKGTVKESEVTLENPLVLRSDEDVTRARKEASRITGQPIDSGPAHILDGEEAFWFTRALLQQGHDGVILEHKEAPGGPQLVVFNADQVGYKPSLRDQIRKELDRNNVEGAVKLTEGVDKKTLEQELQTFIPSFNAKTAKELRQRFANAAPALTKTAVTKAARDRSIRFAEQELREALVNQKRHADGYLGQPMGEASRGIPATEEQLRDPHGIGREVVARMWQVEVDAARAKLDAAKGTLSTTLPGFTMPPRKRSLSSMRDATVDKLDAIDRRLAAESDADNMGVLAAAKQRLTALLSNIENIMLTEANAARIRSMKFTDGKQEVRPSADPEDIVTIAEAEDVPVAEVVKRSIPEDDPDIVNIVPEGERGTRWVNSNVVGSQLSGSRGTTNFAIRPKGPVVSLSDSWNKPLRASTYLGKFDTQEKADAAAEKAGALHAVEDQEVDESEGEETGHYWAVFSDKNMAWDFAVANDDQLPPAPSTDGKPEVRPSADPEDIVTIAEAQDVPVAEVVKGGMAVRQEAAKTEADVIDPTTASPEQLRTAADEMVADAEALARQIHPEFTGRLNGEAILSPEKAGQVAALRDMAGWKEMNLELDSKGIKGSGTASKMFSVAFERFKEGKSRLKGHANSIRNSGSPVFHYRSAEDYGIDTSEYRRVGDYWVYGSESPTVTQPPPTTPRPKLSEGATQTIIQSRGVGNFSGPRNADVRAAIMSEIEGKKVPKSKAGYNAFVDAVANHFGITKADKTTNAYEKAIIQAVKDSVAPAPAQDVASESVVGKRVYPERNAGVADGYKTAKSNLPNHTPVFRIGDWFEFFEDDASLTGAAVTKRNGIRLSAVPYHAVRQLQEIANTTGRPIAVISQGVVTEEITPASVAPATETPEALYGRIKETKALKIEQELAEITSERMNPKSKWYQAAKSETTQRQRELESLRSDTYANWGIAVDALDAEITAKKPISQTWGELFQQLRLPATELSQRLEAAGYVKQGDLYVFQPAPTTPTISDILADVPEGYPLDRDTAKLVSAAVVMPGGLLSAMAANPAVADAVKRYAVSKGIATEGMNATDLAVVVGGELEADSVLAELRGEGVAVAPAAEVPTTPPTATPVQKMPFAEVSEAIQNLDDDARVAFIQSEVARRSASDPNVGLEWDSPYGRQKIVGWMNGGGTLTLTDPTYEVETLTDGSTRRYPASRIQEIINDNTYALTPEYAEETRRKDEQRKVAAENAARQDAEQKAREARLDPYLDVVTRTPMQRGKVRAALLEPGHKRARDTQWESPTKTGGVKNYEGNRFEVTEKLLADGYRPNTAEVTVKKDTSRMTMRQRMDRQGAKDVRNEYRMTKGDSYFVVTKTEHDLALWLIENPQPAAQPPTDTPRNLPSSTPSSAVTNQQNNEPSRRRTIPPNDIANTEGAGTPSQEGEGRPGSEGNITKTGGSGQSTGDVVFQKAGADTSVTEELKAFGFSEGLPTFLANVAKRGQKQHRALAKLLLDVGAGGVPVDLADLPNSFFAGQFQASTGRITVNTAKEGPRGTVDTVLHELVHATTDQSLRRPTEAQAKVIARIERVRRTIIKRSRQNGIYSGDMQYALGDNAEFLTHFFTSQRFRDQVSAMTPKSEKNWLQVIADLIADLFTGRTRAQKMEADLRKELTTLITAPRIGLAPSDVIMRLPAKEVNILRIGDKFEAFKGKTKVSQGFVSESRDGRWKIDAIDTEEKYQRRGYATQVVHEMGVFVKSQGGHTLTSSNEGSGTVQILDKVFGRERVKHTIGAEEVTFNEAVHHMDVKFGYSRSEVDLTNWEPDIRFQPASDARNVARFHQLTESLYRGRDSVTAAEIEAWKAENPEKWEELSAMREEVLRAGGWDVKATHKTDAEFTEFSEKFTGGTGYYFDVSGDYEFRRNINMDVFLKLGAGLNKGEAFQKYPGSGGNPRRQTILQMKNAGYDHWFTESGEIAVFNSEQIKSAEPISPGVRLTPDRWADAASPDIRFQPAARPALLPTEQQFNETINQYVTGEWNPAQREARTDQFVREYAQRFAPTADRLGWVFEFTDSGDVVAGLSERGKPQIEFGMARMRGQVSGSEVNTFRAVAKMVEEEFIHAAHLHYLTSEVADQGQRSAEVFRNSAKVFSQIIDSIRSGGGDAVTEAALASLQTYTPTMVLADLVTMANTNDYVAQDNFVNEFVRQMVQMQNGRPTEEYLAGNKNFLATFMEWLKEKLASLRWAAQNLNLVSPALKENVEGVQAILGDAASPDIRFQPAARNTDAEYLAAVEAGDMETAQRMVDEAARAAGYDLGPIYHGSTKARGSFTVFRNGVTKTDAFRLAFDGLGPGWFTSNREQAGMFSGKEGRILSAHIKLEKPWTIFADEFAVAEHAERYSELRALKKKDRENSGNDPVNGWFHDGLTFEERSRMKELYALGANEEITKGDSWEGLGKLRDEAKLQYPELSDGEAVRRGLSDQGYDGIILEATTADGGFGADTRVGNLWVIPFRGEEQIKSADPVTYDDQGNVIPLSQRFQSTSPDIRFQGLTEQDFTPASLRDTATGFLPDDVTLDDLTIDFADLADIVDGLDPINAENAVHAAVNHALARRAGEAAIPAPVRSEFDSDEAFDAATAEHAAEVSRLTDTYELITRGRLNSEAMFRYRTNPNALQRLVDYLTAAIKAAYNRFTARYDVGTAVALNRMSRDLAKARTGFNHDIEPSRGYDPEAVMMLPAMDGDAEYLAAVEAGDMETAQRMVDDAAKKAGYATKAYHGTPNKPFWVFDPTKRGERTGSNSALLGFFASTDRDVAEQYKMTQRERSNAGYTGPLGFNLEDAEANIERAEMAEAFAEFDEAEQMWLGKVRSFDQWGSEYVWDADRFMYDSRNEAEDAADEARQEEIDKAQKTLDDILLRYKQAEEEMEKERSVLDLFVKLENPLVYDFDGGTFRDKSYTELVQEAIDGGHDGVIMENTVDTIDSEINSDVVVFFKSSQAKSADPVTYDDQGNVIPLSQRFQPTSPDIRFQPAAQPASPARQEQQLLNAQAKNDGWVDLYKDDASVLATADKPEVKNKFLRRVVEALVNPFGALSASATKSVQNRAAMMQTVDYTVSTLGKRLQKAIRDEEADMTAVKLAVGNPDPLLTPSDETRIADDFTAEVGRVTDEIEATYEEELTSDPANAEFNRAVAMAEMRREAERNRKIAIWQARTAEADRRREQQLQALAQLERTAPDTYEAIIDLRGMVNKLQRLAREVNADSPAIQAIIDQSQGVYLVRSFAVHQDPKQIDLMMNSQDPLYAERREALTGFFRDKAYEQIMGELERDPDFLRAYGASYDYAKVIEDMQKKAREDSKTRAQDMFEDFMLGHERSGGSFGQGSTVSNEVQRYMAKTNMPQEFLDALLVNEDPVFNLANTAMSLGRLVYNARMLQEIHDSGVESGRYITEAEMESGVTYADGKAEMRRVFGIDGSNDNIKLHVLDKITNLLHGELKKRYDDGTLDADPDKDQVRVRVATALRSFADTDNVSLADLLPEIGRMADRHAVDAFISYDNKPQEVIANLQPRRGRFATWKLLVSANAGNAAFKPLGGLYADPEQVEAFAATFRTNAKGADHFATKALDVANRSLIGMAGASLAVATQGSPSYYVRNIVGNVFYGLINGVSPLEPQKVALAARTIKNMLSERGEISAEFQELIAGRIVFDAAKIGYLKQLIEDMTANPNATMQDIVGESVNADLKMQGLAKGGKAKAKAFMLRLGKFAEMTEVLSTVMIYADYKNILTEAGFGTEKEIIQEASRLTKRHTPGRSETASGVNAFTRTGFGAFLAPFLRFKVDNIRILPNIWMDAMTWSRSENPVLRKAGQRKLAAATATMGLITIALPLIFQRAVAGLGDDEDRAIRASLPEYYRNSSLFYFRNAAKDGFNIVNLTYTNPLSFVGDPISRIANAVMTGNVQDIPAIMGRFVAEDFIGENIAASNVIDVARNIDSGTNYPIYFEADTSTDKIIKSALHILRSYNPRIVLQGSRFVDSLKREGEQDFWYSPLGVAFATVAPFRPMSVSFDDMERRAFSSVRKENSELWRITSRVFSPAPLAPGDAEEMYEKRTAIMERQAAKALDLYEGFSKIRNGDTASVERSAVSAGISKTRARLLFNRGVTERLKFPDDDMRRIRQLDPARYAEVIEAVRSQPRFKPVER